MKDTDFRAYRKDVDEMIYFDFGDIHSTKGYNGWSTYVFKGEGQDRIGFDLEDDRNVLIMDSLHIRDRNNQFIYFGDVILHRNKKHLITYSNSLCRWIAEELKNQKIWQTVNKTFLINSEVLANIFQDKKLVEGWKND